MYLFVTQLAWKAQATTYADGGENLHTLHEFRAMVEAGGVTFPEPDVTNLAASLYS